jgi:hypothetical protein
VKPVRRFLAGLLALLFVTLSSGGSALAGTKWCAVDPVLTVDGLVSDVTVTFDETYVASLSAPVTFRFHVPSNSKASVTMPPAPVAYTVELLYDLAPRSKRDPVPVVAETLVTANALFATQTVVAVTRTVTVAAYGTSNAVTTLSYSVR